MSDKHLPPRHHLADPSQYNLVDWANHLYEYWQNAEQRKEWGDKPRLPLFEKVVKQAGTQG
jgi:hypothetical protein